MQYINVYVCRVTFYYYCILPNYKLDWDDVTERLINK